MVGTLLLWYVGKDLESQRYLAALFDLVMGLFLVITCWRGLGKRQEQPA